MHQQIAHFLCTQGTCTLHFCGREVQLQAGDCMIAVNSHVGRLLPDADCVLHKLYITSEQQDKCMPYTSYGICGSLHLFMHPIFHLEGEMLSLVEHDFKEIEFRMQQTPEIYRDEAVFQGMKMLYLDAMNAHCALFQKEEATQRTATLMSSFIQMLEKGEFRNHRTVEHYADQLCITPKYLHKVSTQISGRTPSYWIQQFTVMEIRHLIWHQKMPLKEISDRMNFDSVSHFNRYVSEHLGITPGNLK